jgi:hypothetical protein
MLCAVFCASAESCAGTVRKIRVKSHEEENFDMAKGFALNFGWVFAAAVLGFAVAAVFAGMFRLPRNIYLIAYLVLVSPFLYAFMRWSNLSIIELLRHNWIWGLVAAVLVGAFTVRNVLSQPASASSEGLSLAFDVIWLGIVYGTLDALFLSVLPVMATWQAFSTFGWTHSLLGKVLVGVIGLIASLLVTVVYHLGYPEYRVAGGVMGPSIGNTVISLGYILANNPIAAVFSHIGMHIAGVLHGPASVMQLPPHY